MTYTDEELRDDLSYVRNVVRVCCEPHYSDRFARITAHIEELTRAKPRWIPVTERMPRDGKSVQFVVSGSTRAGSYPNAGPFWVDKLSGNRYAPEHVTHWMPMPDAPKEAQRG